MALSRDSSSEEGRAVYSLVDKSIISSDDAALDPTNELKELGVDVFDVATLERGLIDQMDKAMAQDESKRRVKIYRRDLRTISDTIR